MPDTILLVEDDEFIRDSVSRLLSGEGYAVTACADLRQVRDADDLTAFREDPQLLRYHLCSPPTDTGVNLIKNHRINSILIRQHRLNRQHNSGKLSS